MITRRLFARRRQVVQSWPDNECAYDAGMLSAQRIRELVGNPHLTDAEALAIRDDCRRWVEFAFEAYECSGALGQGEPTERNRFIRDGRA